MTLDWRWDTGQPMTFTSWSPLATQPGIRQPDGGKSEECAMIRLDSLHTLNTWHDIPCAFNEVRQYLCKTSHVKTNQHSIVLPSIPLQGCQDGLFQCNNGDCILDYKVDNGANDCGDLSDETNGTMLGMRHCKLIPLQVNSDMTDHCTTDFCI